MLTLRPWLFLTLFVSLSQLVFAQSSPADAIPENERWNFHAQATVIGQTHGAFTSPYSNLNSFQARRESRTSLTTTFFVGLRVWRGGEVYFNPEIAGGKGLSGVVGLTGFPNGDITRVVAPTPKPYLSRVFLRQTWGRGGGSEQVDGGANQLRSKHNARRVTLTVGKIALPDLFDTNEFDHDPRSQFLNWTLMDLGPWDYPADTRGYTWGAALELNQSWGAVRFGSFMVAKVANGLVLDTRLRRNHGEVVEVELPYQRLFRQPGKLKLLAFVNHANMGNYREALRLDGSRPDVTQTRRPGTPKYGLGLNLEQRLTREVGVFLRAGWNDGKTESWMFTESDRSVHWGVQLKGEWWRRPDDLVGAAWVANGLSRDHRLYLTAGGLGFLLGDGRLTYSAERIFETYYRFAFLKHFSLTPDYQYAVNPGCNRDRGPVSVWSLRLHWEL